MSLAFKTISKPNPKNDSLVLINKSSQIKKYSFLHAHEAVISQKITAEKSDVLVFYTATHIHYVGIYFNKEKEISYQLENVRAFAARLQKIVCKEKTEHLDLFGAAEVLNKQQQYALLEGMDLSNYQFLKYKSKKDNYSLKSVSLVNASLTQAELNELQHLMSAVSHTKDLVNEPVITLNAPAFSNEMVQAGIRCGFKVEVLNKAQIKALKMGGLLGVNFGSVDPPTFNIMTYKPKNAVNSKPLIFVGKGVVFDTGGYSLKVGGVMLTMKCDMAGGAAVLGAVSAIALNKLPVYVIGLVPATDNKIDSNALVVDDIITMHDGTTVEVQNTDAEGRLILADALSYAKKFNPELVIDLATLTGAAAAITGGYGSAMMGNDNKYKKMLSESGEETYERLAEMPFWREYEDLLKSDVADLKNIGGPIGGSMTAGKFLEHFTDYNWVHLDIAGPAYLKDAKDYHHKGGSGVGVRLLYHFARRFAKSARKK